MTLEELHAHYKAVRARIENPVSKKCIPEPEPEIVPVMFQMPATPARIILSEVSEKHGVSIEDIQGKSRLMKYVAARQEVCYRLSTELKFSLKQIGRLLGDRDHTTVLHSIRRHKKNLVEGGKPWTRQSGLLHGCDTRT